MHDTASDETLSLAPGELVSLWLEERQVIRVASGQAWITIAGDRHDYWLASGQALALPRGRHIVIEAGSQWCCIDLLSQHAKSLMSARSTCGKPQPIHFI